MFRARMRVICVLKLGCVFPHFYSISLMIFLIVLKNSLFLK